LGGAKLPPALTTNILWPCYTSWPPRPAPLVLWRQSHPSDSPFHTARLEWLRWMSGWRCAPWPIHSLPSSSVIAGLRACLDRYGRAAAPVHPGHLRSWCSRHGEDNAITWLQAGDRFPRHGQHNHLAFRRPHPYVLGRRIHTGHSRPHGPISIFVLDVSDRLRRHPHGDPLPVPVARLIRGTGPFDRHNRGHGCARLRWGSPVRATPGTRSWSGPQATCSASWGTETTSSPYR